MRALRVVKLLSATVLTGVALSACIVAPPPRRVVYEAPAYGPPVAVVDVAPPPPYVEVVPPLPFDGAVWIGGYWGWSGGRHQWVGGHYERGRPGYGWRPHQWAQVNGRWQLHEGGWVRR